MRPIRLLVLPLVVLALSACGNIHPGAAAVVDGDVISMDTLDSTAAAYCQVTARSAQQQGVKTIDNSEIRRNAISDLVMQKIAHDIVQERGLEVDNSLARLSTADAQQIRTGFDDPEAVIGAVEKSYRLYAELVAIGADETGRTPNADILDPLAQAGQAAVVGSYRKHDVTFSPRLGLDADGQPNGGIGSLSVPLPDLDAQQQAELTGPVGCSA